MSPQAGANLTRMSTDWTMEKALRTGINVENDAIKLHKETL